MKDHHKMLAELEDSDLPNLTDSDLLGIMFWQRDNNLEREPFRAVYGPIEYRKHFESFKKSRKLPAQVRKACEAFMKKGHSKSLEETVADLLREQEPSSGEPFAAAA